MTYIATEILKPGKPALVAHRLHSLGDFPNTQAGSSECIFSQATTTQDVFARELDMRPEFFFYFTILSLSRNRPP